MADSVLLLLRRPNVKQEETMNTEVVPTEDGLGYFVIIGELRAFVSSMHLVPDKEAQLRRLQDC